MVVGELALEVLLAYAEWQEGVLRAERPAESAIWSSGRSGREKISWWVLTNRVASSVQRSCEYSSCILSISIFAVPKLYAYLVRMQLGVLGISKQACCVPNLLLMGVNMWCQKFLTMLYSLKVVPLSDELHVLLET